MAFQHFDIEKAAPAVQELRIDLVEGYAERMGDGPFVIIQTAEGERQSVVIGREDLETLLAAA